MSCCNRDCNQGRLCPERAERIREAKRRLGINDGILPQGWFAIGFCAAIIVISVAMLIDGALR